jgi:membrane protease YdiL (CAAX protease family)
MVNGLAVILAVGVLLAMAFRNGFARMQFSGTMPPVVLAWAVLLTELLFYTFAWRRQRIHRKQGRTAPQLWQGATGKALLFGAAAGVSMILASAIYQSALKLLTGRLPVPEALKMLDSANEPWTTAILVFGISLLAPFCEEFFFRGTVLAAAEQAGRLRTGIIASACVFALGHMSLILFPYYVLFALVMAWLFLRTRTLVAPITAHVVLNGTACLLSLLNRDVTV